MNIYNIEGKGGTLLNALEREGFRKETWSLMYDVIQDLRNDGDRDEIGDYMDFYELEKRRYPGYKHKMLQSVIAYMEQYDKYGVLPLLGEKCRIGVLSGRRVLCRRYRRYVDQYEKMISGQGLKSSTFRHRIQYAVHFLCYLQSLGVCNLHKVSEQVVLGYFHRDGRKQRGETIVRYLRIFFRTIAHLPRQGDCQRILRWLPHLRRHHHPYPFFSDHEMAALKGVLYSEGVFGYSYRDRAMVGLALYTGMRTSDIVKLRLSEVDMERDMITFVQEKTSEPQRIPLQPVVGRAIYEYVKYERPRCEEPYIFLREKKNGKEYGRLSTSTFYSMVQRVYDAAGIPGSREARGLHVLRHNFAIELMNKDVSAVMIQSLLGHRNPGVIESYLESSTDLLRSCSLSVERWPVDREIFNFGKHG